MIVYVVEAGAYSEKHIERIYSTEEKAQKFVERFNQQKNYGNARYYEYILDEEVDQEWLNGEVSYWDILFSPNSADIAHIDLSEYKDVFSFQEGYYHYNHVYWCEVRARDEEHAAKIAMEHRTRYIVENNLQEIEDE